jgi:uncharacterized protein (TIGR03790 family)
MGRLLASLGMAALTGLARADGLVAERLGVVFNADDPASRELAIRYVVSRRVPYSNLVAVHLGTDRVIAPEQFTPRRATAIGRLPTRIQALALTWSRPFAVGCMSVTTAFAAGYRAGFCEAGCGLTTRNPLFDTDGWWPADTVAWWPAMLIPSAPEATARRLIARGIAADGTNPPGRVYLVRTADPARNVRAITYPQIEAALGRRLRIVELASAPSGEVPAAMGYFTGVRSVDELRRIHFLPGAVADHLTSTGGVLEGGHQMPATAWLEQGATASYGTVSEPCNRPGKFPNIEVLLKHYLRGETVLEAYWKSVQMPGQGLFVGEPLARPYAAPPVASRATAR